MTKNGIKQEVAAIVKLKFWVDSILDFFETLKDLTGESQKYSQENQKLN